jgi:hypothetical protein
MEIDRDNVNVSNMVGSTVRPLPALADVSALLRMFGSRLAHVLLDMSGVKANPIIIMSFDRHVNISVAYSSHEQHTSVAYTFRVYVPVSTVVANLSSS